MRRDHHGQNGMCRVPLFFSSVTYIKKKSKPVIFVKTVQKNLDRKRKNSNKTILKAFYRSKKKKPYIDIDKQ